MFGKLFSLFVFAPLHHFGVCATDGPALQAETDDFISKLRELTGVKTATASVTNKQSRRKLNATKEQTSCDVTMLLKSNSSYSCVPVKKKKKTLSEGSLCFLL